MVSGDGLKFDSLWVDWGGGEIISTSTGWFWQDIRSGFFMAYRLAQTETMDLIRLATYDLTAICVPRVVQLDNTRAASNKPMAGGMNGNNRFRLRPGEREGLLKTIGVERVMRTLPDKVTGNPGAKPIERPFRDIHKMVRTNLRFHGRGYSKKTAVPVSEFREVVAEEVVRFNQREGRRSPICGGKLSFEQAFRKDFEHPTNEVRKLAPKQREILKRMPKAVRVNPRDGTIFVRVTTGELGKIRYWSEDLLDHKGEDLTAYCNPADLKAPVTVVDLDGRPVCTAKHLGDPAFNDTAAAGEHAKNKRRYVKAQKKAAEAYQRMTALEAAALSPKPEAAEPPEAGVVAPNFRQQVQVVNGGVAAPPAAGEYSEEERRHDRDVIAMGDRILGFREGAEGW